MLERAGAQIITCHGRIREQCSQNTVRPRGWWNVDPVYRVGGGGVRSGVEFFFVTY
jgi:hypothetical protein